MQGLTACWLTCCRETTTPRSTVAAFRSLLYKLPRALMGLFVMASTLVVLISIVSFLLSPTLAFPSYGLQQLLPSYLQSNKLGWGRIPGAQDDCGRDTWNVLYHLGGNGPWIEKVDGVAKGGIAVPEGCEVDMVHMVSVPFSRAPFRVLNRLQMSRHAERYPTKSAGARMRAPIHRPNAALTGP